MPQVVDIPAVGEVEFPDSMDDAAINQAAAKLYREAVGTSGTDNTGGEQLTPEEQAQIDYEAEHQLLPGRTGLAETLRRARASKLAKGLLGPTALEREAGVGVKGRSPGEIASTMLKFTSVPPPVADVARPVLQAPVNLLPIPETAKAILNAPTELALSVPLAPIPAGLAKPVVAAFTADFMAHVPEQKKAYEEALARGDTVEATRIAAQFGIGALATGAMVAHAGTSRTPLTDQAKASVTEAKGTEKSPPPPSPTAVVSESGTVPVSAGNIPPARATLPLEEAQGRPTQGVSTEGARKQAEPEQAVYPVRYSRETGGMVDALGRSVDAEHKVIGKPPPVEPISMGGATPAELTPAPLKTAVKNAEVDKTREGRGLSPILGPERQRNPEVWDRVMQKIDADPTWQDRLIEETKKTPRALTPDETLALDHRYVDLQNEYGKAVRDGEQHMADGYELGVEEAKTRAAFYEGKLNEVEQVAKTVGTESGRSLAMRRQLIKEDFSLASMESRMRAAKGFKPLTPGEHAQIKGLREKLDAAEKALAEAEAKVKDRVILNPRMPLDPKVARKRGEVQLLQDQFLRDLEGQRQKQRTLGQKAWINTKETANVSRSILTAFDVSAVGRQGWLIGVGNPARAARAIGPMFRALRSDKIAAEFEEQIKARPNYQNGTYARMKLFLAPREGKLTGQEEAFMSRLASRIAPVAASQRAYVTFLNLLRADTADALVKNLTRDGKGTPEELQVIGNFVNVFTGRGPLGKAEPAAEALATAFFSPRLVVSRFQVLVGQPMWKGSASTRYLVAKEYAKTLTGLAVVYGLAKLAGADVETDRRSADFGKIRFGNTRIDVLAGLSQVTVFVKRFTSGEAKSGNKVYQAKSGDTLMQFARNKLAPLPGAALDLRDILLDQNPPPGHPESLPELGANMVIPMAWNDLYDIMLDQGIAAGTAIELVNLFGFSAQSYDSNQKRPKQPKFIPSP